MNKQTFVDYRPEWAGEFAALNMAWLEKYFQPEPLDKIVLADPETHIINKGGHIFFALVDNEVAGCFALLKKEEDLFELGKMAVDEKYQGNKIGNQMLQFCIHKARELKIKKLVLYSNTKLAPAIHLYRKFGFTEVPIGSTEYTRANIKMELDINTQL